MTGSAIPWSGGGTSWQSASRRRTARVCVRPSASYDCFGCLTEMPSLVFLASRSTPTRGLDLVETVFTCMYCGGTRSEVVYSGCRDYYLGKPFTVDYVRCTDCGLVQQTPLPGDVSDLYEAYPVHQEKSALHEWVRRLLVSAPYFGAAAHGEGTVLLDYGCGDGWYLDSMKHRGFQLLGFEPDHDHARVVSERLGLTAYADRDDLVSAHADSIDVITMHFVLEHLTDLHGAFATVSALLRPGGTFYLVVPNIDSAEARIFGKKWHGLDPPRHISFPGQAVVEGLGSEHGMLFERSRHVPFPNGVAGSLPVVVSGRFVYPLFLLSLPLAIVVSRLAPGGTLAYTLTKREASAVSGEGDLA